jgi:hypothetical protein
MKKNLKALFCILLIITFSFSYVNQAFGQEEADTLDIDQLFEKEKVNISVGLGFPEALNISVRYQLEQLQIGISAGYIPTWMDLSISGYVHYHFAGFSKLSNRRPWFVRGGLSFSDQQRLNLRIGRDFNISRKIGFEIGLGVTWCLDLFPTQLENGIGVAIFYRI